MGWKRAAAQSRRGRTLKSARGDEKCASEVHLLKRCDEWALEQGLALAGARRAYFNSVFPGVRVKTLYKSKAGEVHPVNILRMMKANLAATRRGGPLPGEKCYRPPFNYEPIVASVI